MCARKWGCSPRCGWYPEDDDDDDDDIDDDHDDVVLGVGGTLREGGYTDAWQPKISVINSPPVPG